MQRIEIDVLDWESVLVVAIKLAATFGLPDMDPVCRLVARSGESYRFHEGLQEYRLVPVGKLPVARETASDTGEDV